MGELRLIEDGVPRLGIGKGQGMREQMGVEARGGTGWVWDGVSTGWK